MTLVQSSLQHIVNFRTYVSNRLSDSELIYITEGADWVVKNIGEELSNYFKKNDLIKYAVNTQYKGLQNKLIHFGSKHTLQALPHVSNKVIVSWFHVEPQYTLDYPFTDTLDRIDRIHTAALMTKKTLVNLGIPEKKITVIPLGINLSQFKPVNEKHKTDIKQRLGIPSGKYVIGSFQKDGNGWGEGLDPKLIKGPDIICDTVEMLSKRHPIHVLLTGPARGYVKKRLEKMNVPYTHYNVLNHYDVREYYNALDLYIIPARIEGGPYALLESWASGIPIVSTNVGMVADIGKDNKNILITKNPDPKDLAVKAEKILKQPKLKQKLIDAGLEAVKQYDWHIIGNRYYEELYIPLLRTKKYDR